MIDFNPLIVESIVLSVSTAIQQLVPILSIFMSVTLTFFVLRKIIFLITLSKR